MKLKKLFHVFWIVTALGCLCPTVSFASATLDVTNITADSSTLTLNAVVSDQAGLKAGGFVIAFPTDRLAFAGAETAVDGVILQSSASGSRITAGYMIASDDVKRLEIRFNFRITGEGPYLVAADRAEYKDDLAGCSVSRPGLYGTSDEPVMWSVPDSVATLFIYIPALSEITDIELTLDGQDVLSAIMEASSWYVDPVMDSAYLVLPGVSVPAGSYPVRLAVEYGDRSQTAAADVIVR